MFPRVPQPLKVWLKYLVQERFCPVRIWRGHGLADENRKNPRFNESLANFYAYGFRKRRVILQNYEKTGENHADWYQKSTKFWNLKLSLNYWTVVCSKSGRSLHARAGAYVMLAGGKRGESKSACRTPDPGLGLGFPCTIRIPENGKSLIMLDSFSWTVFSHEFSFNKATSIGPLLSHDDNVSLPINWSPPLTRLLTRARICIYLIPTDVQTLSVCSCNLFIS